ncbi:hypothetical protein [Calothrix sp. UHCC 0171]|uniref:hypothetical protein n=1 Tax=Calothrix sp. UHCC 0171 TaxID=3110245 RepID=UPI002B207D9C|nr:hypothetical protein [Calothrix sp. UHCC 0171]MEA5572651.1 hypothetical protein [Calothrix sp. UHCC 0171]
MVAEVSSLSPTQEFVEMAEMAEIVDIIDNIWVNYQIIRSRYSSIISPTFRTGKIEANKSTTVSYLDFVKLFFPKNSIFCPRLLPEIEDIIWE